MKTLIGTIALASMAHLIAFPAAADTTDDSQGPVLVNEIEADEELTIEPRVVQQLVPVAGLRRRLARLGPPGREAIHR